MWKTPLAQVDELLTGLEAAQLAVEDTDDDGDDSNEEDEDEYVDTE